MATSVFVLGGKRTKATLSAIWGITQDGNNWATVVSLLLATKLLTGWSELVQQCTNCLPEKSAPPRAPCKGKTSREIQLRISTNTDPAAS